MRKILTQNRRVRFRQYGKIFTWKMPDKWPNCSKMWQETLTLRPKKRKEMKELSSEVENKPSSNGEKYPRFSCFSPVFGIKKRN